MTRALLLIGLLLAGCPGVEPVRPDPVPTPEPAPSPEPPTPVTGTPCERAAARAVELGCDFAGSGFLTACERYEEEARSAPALGWNPECMAAAQTCVALEGCRAR